MGWGRRGLDRDLDEVLVSEEGDEAIHRGRERVEKRNRKERERERGGGCITFSCLPLTRLTSALNPEGHFFTFLTKAHTYSAPTRG